MKDRRLILAGLFVAILLFVGWWFWSSQSPSPAEGPTKAINHRPTPSGSISNAFPPGKAPWQQMKSKAEIIREVMDAENAKPLDFYGKIIDQYGQPIEGVEVRAGIGLYVSFTRSGGYDRFTKSDAEGEFSFVGVRGAGMGLFFKKDGFVFNGNASRPNNYIPDPNNPVTFTMWKLKGVEPMVHTEIQAGLACDGTPRNFDVLAGKRDAGDLVATLKRTPVNIERGKPFDWALTLNIPGGGLIEIKDVYPNEAPADGYQSVAITMPADTGNWTPSVVRSYYFFDGKNYGRITINIMANYQPPPTHVEFEAYVNPSGSRNLEYDEAKRIDPSRVAEIGLEKALEEARQRKVGEN